MMQSKGPGRKFVEHVVGLRFVNSRDGSLPRFRVLRQTIGTLGMLPLAMVESGAGALSLERALIISLQPNCNGADVTVFCKPKGYLLAPTKAGRCRPPAPLRAPTVSSDTVWSQLHSDVQLKKQTQQASSPRVPRLPYGNLYQWLPNHIHRWSSSFSIVTSALVVLGVCLGLWKLGYPVDLLRALLHSLPKWPSAILASQVVSVFPVLGRPPWGKVVAVLQFL